MRKTSLFVTVAAIGAFASSDVFAQAATLGAKYAPVFKYVDGQAQSRVFLNGIPTPVYFNDGDSFRVLAGKHYNTRARLAGFNTLETFGPAHRWGTWHAKELYALAKLGTMNAQRGEWHCTSETFETDTYGRVLWDCPDLAMDQIRRGLAHAMSVTYDRARPDYLKAQADAIKNRRGIWAHGVPRYVLTSLHSVAEGGGRDGKTYNRLVSSEDGHSAKWEHADDYDECEWVCREERMVPDAQINEAVEALIVDTRIGERAVKLGDEKMRQIVLDYATLGYFGGVDEVFESILKEKLDAMIEAGTLSGNLVDGSCALFVVFERRYNADKPGCLKW